MPTAVKHRSLGLREALFTCFTQITLDTFIRFPTFNHVSMIYFLILFTCFIHAKRTNCCYLHIFHQGKAPFCDRLFSDSTTCSQEGDHRWLKTAVKEPI